MKHAEVMALEVLKKAAEAGGREGDLKSATEKVATFPAQSPERAKLELARDEQLRRTQDEDKRYQIAKDLSDNLTVSYNTSEVIMARLMQTTSAKERVYAQAVTFFSTNDSVLTAFKASFTGMFGLHESTKTLDAMKEGMSKGLETLSEVGDKVTEAAVRSGYGPTIRADAVKKLVDSVVNFQEHSTEIIAEMRKLATQNSAEIRDAVEDGKKRMVRLIACRRHATLPWRDGRIWSTLMTETGVAPSQPKALDDVMIAMDVVDTLRHREDFVRRELNEEARESELIARLRQIYRDQGIEVPDHVLADGVKALKDSRFVYTPPPASWKRTLLTLWVKRETYGKRLGMALAAPDRDLRWLSSAGHTTGQARRRANRIEITETLPKHLRQVHADVVAVTTDEVAKQKAAALLADGERAIRSGDRAAMIKIGADLVALRDEVTREYTLTIVSRPGESYRRMAPPAPRWPGAQLLPDRRGRRPGWPEAHPPGPQ